jgi:hypothetical protein
MNLKLVATVTSILTSVLLVYFFFIIMKPNTNEKVVPTYLKNGVHNDIDTDTDTDTDDELDPDMANDYINGVDNRLLNTITPLSNDTESCVPANELKLENYKDLENFNTEKEVYTNDAPLFMTSGSKNEAAKPFDLNSQHRRVNFY